MTGIIGPDGGIVEGPDGFALGVPQGNLATEVEVTLARTPHPTIPFGAEITPLGRSYRLESDTDAYGSLPTGQYLVALPVPEGVASDHLALAVLDPGETRLDGGEDIWLYVEGRFLSDDSLFVAPHPALLTAGDVVRLVSADRFASPPPDPSGTSGVATQQTCSGWFPGFDVDAGTGVSDATATFVAARLDQALASYRSRGFDPFLLELSGDIVTKWTNPPTIIALDCSTVRYRAHLRIVSGRVSGGYHPQRKTLILYTSRSTPLSELTDTIYHELFHAIQNAHLGVAEVMDPARKYFLEGSAALAERSRTSFVKSAEYGPRFVDIPLDDRGDCPTCLGLEPYETQDFWMYVADQHTFDFPAFMKSFFDGASVAPDTVDGVLRGPFGTSLPERYLDWSRQQTYTIGPCTYEENVDSLEDLGTVRVGVHASGVPDSRSLDLSPLTSEVFKLVVDDTDTETEMQLALLLRDDFDDVASDEIATTVFEDIPGVCNATQSFTFEMVDGDAVYRFREDETQNPVTHYILVANGQFDDSAIGEMIVDGAPEITGTPRADPSGLIADQETDVTFTLPFADAAANIAKIHGRFEFDGSSEVFDLTWEHDEEFVDGFTDQESGDGTIELVIVVYCSEEGTSTTVTATWQLEDELGFKGEEESTNMNVSFGVCTTLRDGTAPESATGIEVSKR